MVHKMEKYEQIAIVGEGSYGTVTKCRHKDTDQIVAIKKFLETEEDATVRKLALREIRMLKRLKHENLVTMIEAFRHRKRFYIVFEFLEGTVLDELEKFPAGLGDEKTRERIYQVCRAINYCHTNNIIHRDIKPENVLISSLGVVKLCDFGFARHLNLNGEAYTEYVATRWYRAPELLVGESIYGPPVDIWAIGCLFAEMMTGDPLFPGENDIDQLYLIVKMLGQPCIRHKHLMFKNNELRLMIKAPSTDSIGFYNTFPTWPLIAIDFLNGCNRMDPQERLTAEELLKHHYFTHDRFPQRFLPALREKVHIQFSAPLLRKFKSDILHSTDRKQEIKTRKLLKENRWKLTLTEGTIKRKYNNYDTIESNLDKNLITLEKSSQRLNVLNNNGNNLKSKNDNQILPKQASQSKNHSSFKTDFKQTHFHNNNLHTLEKSFENLVKIKGQNSGKYSVLSSSQSNSSTLEIDKLKEDSMMHHPFNLYSDINRSPNLHQNLLHPNTNFKDILNKKSPTNSLYGNPGQRLSYILPPPITNSRNYFLKKSMIEDLCTPTEQSNIEINSITPHWLNNTIRKRETINNKGRNDDFSLPNLPGASVSPSNKKKNSVPEIEFSLSNEVSPAYRYKKAKRKRNELDLSVPQFVKMKFA